jgi:hypothetical protein
MLCSEDPPPPEELDELDELPPVELTLDCEHATAVTTIKAAAAILPFLTMVPPKPTTIRCRARRAVTSGSHPIVCRL